MPLKYEQQPNESGEAFHAFSIYRDLGPSRTLAAAYNRHRQDRGLPPAKQPSGTWTGWHRKQHWSDRARSWDEKTDTVVREARLEVIRSDATAQQREIIRHGRREEQEDAEWELRQKLLEKARAMLEWPIGRVEIEKGVKVIAPAKWSFFTLTHMIEMISKLGRLSAHMPVRIAEEKGEQGEGDERFFETGGQIADALPPNAAPEMPADTFAKPDIAPEIARGASASTLMQPPKPRPGNVI